MISTKKEDLSLDLESLCNSFGFVDGRIEHVEIETQGKITNEFKLVMPDQKEYFYSWT